MSAQPYLAIAMPAFAIVVCLIWWQMIAYYDNLFAAKFRVLRKIEEAGGFFPIYEQEYEFIKEGKPPHSMLRNDRLVPLLLSILFLVVSLYMICKLHR